MACSIAAGEFSCLSDFVTGLRFVGGALLGVGGLAWHPVELEGWSERGCAFRAEIPPDFTQFSSGSVVLGVSRQLLNAERMSR